jgi:hypothetical protein
MEVRSQTSEEGVDPILARTRWVWDEYHRVLEIPLIGGSDISGEHTNDVPRVVVINETLAQQAFRGADPVGETLLVSMGSQSIPFEIVGVSADTRNAGLEATPNPEIAFAMRQAGIGRVTLLVDSAIMPANWLRTLEEAIWRVDPDQPILRSYRLTDDLGNQTRRLRFFAVTTGWFAVLALLLGAAGVNAVVSAAQRRRVREIGLRMALGAAPRQAAALVLGGAARIVGLGLGIGVLVAGLVMVWLRDDLFGVDAKALWSLGGLTALVLIVAGLTAAAWPAWRAARIPPMGALRYD